MNRLDLSKIVAKKYNVTQSDSKDWTDAIINTLGEVISKNSNVAIHGLGVFKHGVRKAKKYRHPATGELMDANEKPYIKFIPSESVINGMNK